MKRACNSFRAPLLTRQFTMATTTPPAAEQPKLTQREIVQQFEQRRNELQRLAAKVTELEAEADEHLLVINNMKGLDASRKCWRLVNGVLIELHVGTVLPDLTNNAQALRGLVGKYKDAFLKQEKELEAFMEQHQIRITNNPAAAAQRQQ